MKKTLLLAVSAFLSVASVVAQPSALDVPTLAAQPAGFELSLPAQLQSGPHRVPTAPIAVRPAGKVYENLVANFTGALNSNGAVSVGAYNWRISEIVEGDDGFVYIKGIPLLLGAGTYVQAERAEGDTIVVKKQIIYSAAGTNYYITRMKWEYIDQEAGTGNFVEDEGDIKLIYNDGKLKSVSEDANPFASGYVIGSTYGSDEAGYVFTGRVEYDVDYFPVEVSKVELPAGVTPETLVLDFTNSSGNRAFSQASVAITDDAVYIDLYEGSYIKGDIDGDKVVFPGGQYLGLTAAYGYHLFLQPARVDTTFNADGSIARYQAVASDQVVFTLDRANHTLTTNDVLIVNAGQGSILALTLYWAPSYYTFVEVPAVPANPSFAYYNYLEAAGYNYLLLSIQPVDVDGNYITPDKLSYIAYVDGELFVFAPEEYPALAAPLEEVPYGVSLDSGISPNYFMLYFAPGETVGLQTVYYGGDKENRSGIVYLNLLTGESYVEPYDNSSLPGPLAIESAAASQVVSVAYHDVQGRSVAADARGLLIKTLTLADGTTRTVKVVRR